MLGSGVLAETGATFVANPLSFPIGSIRGATTHGRVGSLTPLICAPRSKENVWEHQYWQQMCHREEGALVCGHKLYRLSRTLLCTCTLSRCMAPSVSTLQANLLSNHLQGDIAYLAGGLGSTAGEVFHCWPLPAA